MVAGSCWHLVLRFGCCIARQARLSACHCELLFLNEVRRFIQGALDNLFIINTDSCHLCRRFQEVPALQPNGSHCKKEIKTGWNQFSHLLESRVLDAKPSGSQIEEGQNQMRAKEQNALNCRSSCDPIYCPTLLNRICIAPGCSPAFQKSKSWLLGLFLKLLT